MLNTGDKITAENASLLKPGDWLLNTALAEEGPFVALVASGIEWKHPKDRPRGEWQKKLSPFNLMRVVALAREDDPGGFGLAEFRLGEVRRPGPLWDNLEPWISTLRKEAEARVEDVQTRARIEETITKRLASFGIFPEKGPMSHRRYLMTESGAVLGIADAAEAANLLVVLESIEGRAAGALLAEAHGQDDAEAPIIWAMAKAHDREESAQKGEPSPWREDFERDPDFEQDRFLAMREAFDVAKPLIAAEPNALLRDLVRILDAGQRPGGGSVVPQKIRDYLDGKRSDPEAEVVF